MTIESKRKTIINVLYLVLILGIAYLFFKYLFFVVLPFIIGLFVAAAIQKPINLMNRKFKIPKAVTAIVLVLFILCVLAAAVWQIAYRVAGEAGSLASFIATYLSKDFPDQVESFKNTIPNLLPSLGIDSLNSAKPLIDGQTIISKLQELLTQFANWIINFTANVAKALPNMLVSFIITIVSCCFFSIDYDNIVNFIKAQLSDKGKSIISNVKHTIFSSLFKIVRSYAIIMFITFCELSVALRIMNIDHPIAISSVIAIVDILPVLGVGTVLIPWIIVEIIIGNVPLAVGLAIAYAIITVVRNIIEPKIVGSQIGLHPVATLMSMYIGVKLLGGTGLIIFPITLIILTTLQNDGEIHIWNSPEKEEKEEKEKFRHIKKLFNKLRKTEATE